jgi:hypothetical protein
VPETLHPAGSFRKKPPTERCMTLSVDLRRAGTVRKPSGVASGSVAPISAGRGHSVVAVEIHWRWANGIAATTNR